MHEESLGFATEVAKFLKDYGPYATNVLLIAAVVHLFKALRKADAEKLDVALKVVPLADKLSRMVARAAASRGASHRAPENLP